MLNQMVVMMMMMMMMMMLMMLTLMRNNNIVLMMLMNNTPSLLLARKPLTTLPTKTAPEPHLSLLLVPPTHLVTRNAMYLNMPPVPLPRCSIRCVCGHVHLGPREVFVSKNPRSRFPGEPRKKTERLGYIGDEISYPVI